MDFVQNSLHCHVNSPLASPLFLHQSPYHLRNREHHGICGYVAPILDQKGVRTRGVSYLSLLEGIWYVIKVDSFIFTNNRMKHHGFAVNGALGFHGSTTSLRWGVCKGDSCRDFRYFVQGMSAMRFFLPGTHRIHGAGVFTYIWLVFMVNVVGTYTIHGSYGVYLNFLGDLGKFCVVYTEIGELVSKVFFSKPGNWSNLIVVCSIWVETASVGYA